MNLLTIENLSKVFTERQVFDQADFSVNEGEKIGVIGVNGTGKSTLLKIIAGLEEPDSGKVTLGNNLVLGYLPQKPEFEEGMTVLQAALAGNKNKINEWSIESEAKTMLLSLGIDEFEKSVHQLSGGQKKRVALANVLLKEPDILILDEPTNHLDGQMAQWLEDFLIRFRGALVMVTHDRYFLDRVATRIVEVDQGKIYSYPGSYSEFVRLKEERQNMEIATERKRQSILRKELEWLMRGARARSTKQKAHIQRIEIMQEKDGPAEECQVQMSSLSSRLGRKTVEVEGLCKAYGDRQLIRDFTYIFLKGDRVGITGPNGCGKSTLLKMIVGEVEPDAGTIEIGQTVKIGYFSQESESLDDNMRVIDYIKEAGEYVQTTEGTITAAQMLERFLFDGAMQWSLIGKLSGGEKRRLYLLRILMTAPNVLILDEPTNDLDIRTLTILEDYLDGFDGIVITVSHDRYFLDRVVRRMFAFEENGKIRQYEGGFSDYQVASAARAEENGTPVKAEEAEAPKEKTEKPRTRKLKFTYNEEKEYAVIDEEIEALEEKVKELDLEIVRNATDYPKLSALTKEKEETEEKLMEKMERWEYLTDLAERIEQERGK
ncbi:ABC-F family ATP-binding cassette domain-containing protein [Fusicatenibacter faecihominis]|uniref:ABC-F family ATP-binding cassette domain-containing protein n=1 Tax=Fusicatenibacter faecihominis TaxID=2881276 RepID=A0AAE3DUS3_9FIRM|nr:ABC-F family ATP-binding cassette domain-containing protein [Fusicatenibacter faecihominis]MCC2190936.1 ABC-F family ATP-binding cassette domain-containing protein [Fusicatenibacter faecihominis]